MYGLLRFIACGISGSAGKTEIGTKNSEICNERRKCKTVVKQQCILHEQRNDPIRRKRTAHAKRTRKIDHNQPIIISFNFYSDSVENKSVSHW